MVHQRIGGQVKDIYTFKFWKQKYGPELPVISDMSIEEISETPGFETSTYFIRSFGKRYGVTPLQYRKSNKE